MRSSVSYILSHAPGESVMSHPDYGQHAQHHACLLVLVKGIGGMLKNFNKLWERIQKVNNIKVTDSSGQVRDIWVRYVRDYPVENNDWGDFQTHRRLLGLITLSKFTNQVELNEVCRVHESLKVKYSNTLYDSRAFMFGPVSNMKKPEQEPETYSSYDDDKASKEGSSMSDNFNGWCDVSYDPNSAAPCDPHMCELPNCFCSKNGTETPGSLVASQTPQMITLTFTGPVNHENWDLLTKHLLPEERENPNGCPIKATFFVPHSYTNYRHVQKLWNDGHEIAVNSITNRRPEEWWSRNATVEDWFDEMVGQANIINRFSRVRMEDFRGLRAPYLSVGWNRQFLMMQEFGFVYDASVVAPRTDPPFWPYTFDYKMPHRCYGDNQYCPTRSYAGLWEMVINPLVHGKETCATLDQCPKPARDEVYNILINNFKRHYLTNRAPFGIHLNTAWLKSGEDYLAEVKKFIGEILKLPDVYFVTNRQVIEWIKRPTPVLQLKNFFPWMCKERRFADFELACIKPTTCKLPTQMMALDRYMITCTECPKTYPWLRNEFGVE